MKTIDIHAHLVPRSLWKAVDAQAEWYGFCHEPGPVAGTITLSGITAQNYNTPLVVSPLQFGAGSTNYLSVLSQYGPGTGNFVATYNNVNVDATSGFAGTVYGLGFNLECYSCTGTPNAVITVTDSSNAVFTFSALSSANYFGIRSGLAISNVNISYGTAGYAALDDVGYGGSNTPEAATLFLIGTGLAFFYRYRKYSTFASAA